MKKLPKRPAITPELLPPETAQEREEREADEAAERMLKSGVAFKLSFNPQPILSPKKKHKKKGLPSKTKSKKR